MRSMEPLVYDMLNKQLPALCERGEMDLVSDLLFEIPGVHIYFELFGVPREKSWITCANLPNAWQYWVLGDPNEHEQVAMTQGLAEFWDYCRNHVARLIDNPGDDAISEFIRLLQSGENGETLDPEYVSTVTFQMFFAGHETTVNATAGGMRALCSSIADQWQELM